MQEYHMHLENQPQPTHNMTTLQQKEKTWHDLAEHYGLKDMMTISPAIELGHGIEKEFDTYSDGPLSPPGTDLLGFWGVSTLSLMALPTTTSACR
jgi:hypothetical protein